MTDTNSGIKYSRQLAINETTSRRQLEQLELFNDEADPVVTELKKSLYTFNVAYSTIFDGLAYACTTLYDKKWEDKNGNWHDIIGRKNDATETHYRLFAPEEFIKQIFAGQFEDEWPNIRNQLLKLAFKNEPKKLMIDKTHHIIDAPIKVTPWYETESIEKFINLSPRRKGKTKQEREEKEREAGKAKGRIIGFSIEFFKPLFEPLLEINTKQKTGRNYLLTPPFFQLKLNAMFKGGVQGIHEALIKKHGQLELIMQEAINILPKKERKIIAAEKNNSKIRMRMFENKVIRKMESVTPLGVRKFYLALALKDNHRGEYISIDNFMEFVDGIWPELIREDRNKNKVLQPAEYNEAIEKINMILQVYFQVMARRGDMDGGQIVPLEIIPQSETGEEFNMETNRLRIRCIKKNTLFSKYTLQDIAQYIAEK